MSTLTSIIAVLMLAGLLACLAFGQEPAKPVPNEGESRAIAQVKRLGGTVYREHHDPDRPVNVVYLYEPITDADLDVLTAFPGLQSLRIYKGRISDAGLARLAELPRLRQVEIRNSPISDAGVVTLGRAPNLRSIDLIGTGITEAGTARLKELLPYVLIRVRPDESSRDGSKYGLIRFLALTGLIGAFAALLALQLARSSWSFVRRRRWLWKAPFVAAVILIMTVSLAQLMPVMRPIKDRSPAEFWLTVTELEFGVKEPHGSIGGVYRPRDGWFIYYIQGFHGRDLYRVPVAEASAMFPKVAERLRNAPPGVLNPDVEEAFHEWDRSGAAPDDAVGFLDRLRETRAARVERTSPAFAEELRSEHGFAERWGRAGRCHWNVAFEFVFLAGLILFAAWPWHRGASRRWWALHLGALPTLFCLPYWLGYAPLTFTSAGPVGGVLYPWLLGTLRGLPWTSADTFIVRNLPRLLEPLSQSTGPMLSLSFFGGPGPVAAAACGLAMALSLYVIRVVIRRLANGPRAVTRD